MKYSYFKDCFYLNFLCIPCQSASQIFYLPKDKFKVSGPKPGTSLGLQFPLTSKKGQSSHGREGMVPRSIQKVELVDLPSDPVQLAVEVFNGGSIAVFELRAQEPRDQRGFAHAS